jgi:hypothetical protein
VKFLSKLKMSLQGFRSIEKYIIAIPTYLKILLIRGGFDSLVAISKMDKVDIDDLDKLYENNCESLRLGFRFQFVLQNSSGF